MRDPGDLRELAEDAVEACLPLVPLVGSSTTGFTLSPRIDHHVVALPEEWATAAVAIGNLHAALHDLPSTEERLDASGGPYTVELDPDEPMFPRPKSIYDEEESDPEGPLPWWMAAILLGIAVAVIYVAVTS